MSWSFVFSKLGELVSSKRTTKKTQDGQDEAQDGQDEAQDGQDEAQDGQDEDQDGYVERPDGQDEAEDGQDKAMSEPRENFSSQVGDQMRLTPVTFGAKLGGKIELKSLKTNGFSLLFVIFLMITI